MIKKLNVSSKNGYEIPTIASECDNVKKFIIVLHGFNGDKWGDGYERLQHAFDDAIVCSFDCYAHGKSPTSSEEITMEKVLIEIDDVINYLVQTYGQKPIILYGCSFGGYRALIFAATRPNLIKHLVLANPVFNMLEILERLRGFSCNTLKETEIVYMKQSKNKVLSHKFIFDLKEYDVYKLYQTYHCPVAIFRGDDDDLIPYSQFNEFKKINNCNIYHLQEGHQIEKDESWNLIIKTISEIK